MPVPPETGSVIPQSHDTARGGFSHEAGDRAVSGVIFNIVRFCVEDGPGIRTTVFFKGCPLRCLWCHNPESQSPRPALLYAAERCTACGACVSACPHGCHRIEAGAGETAGRHVLNRTDPVSGAVQCTACGACAAVCPHGALEMAGRTACVGELIDIAVRDRAYYAASGGGLTLSGGEPLFQPEFALALLRAAKAVGLHTCVETCGAVSVGVIRQAAAVTDLFLYDYKETDPARHRALTGQDNARILDNLRELDRLGAAVVLRAPYIPGCNNSPAHTDGIAAAAALSCVLRVEVMPYHPLGEAKAVRLGAVPFTVQPPSDADIATWVAALRARTPKPIQCDRLQQ